MSKFQVHLIITAFAIIIFLPGLGLVHLFDWDELNFAESAREMVVSHNYNYVQIAFEPFWEKPPFLFGFKRFLSISLVTELGYIDYPMQYPESSQSI